jgi:hypothetical protein
MLRAKNRAIDLTKVKTEIGTTEMDKKMRFYRQARKITQSAKKIKARGIINTLRKIK